MAEPKPYTFVLSDESINSYGFRVLTAGIDLKDFKKNPIMFWNHSRTWRGSSDEILPIGRWDNIRVEGTRLLADAVFDEKDEFAQKIKSKVDQKIINMASAGFNVVATSEDPAALEKGQTRPTVIKCRMKEASVVDIGSNKNALHLYDEFGSEINLSDRDNNHLLPLLSDIQNQQTDMKLQEQIAQVLKLSDNASEADILTAVQNSANAAIQLADLNGQITTLKAEKTNLETELQGYKDAEKEAETQERIDLVDQAIAAKKITASEKETYLALAEKDFENTKKILDAKEGVTELGEEDGGEVKLSAWDARMNEINKNLKK